MTPEQTDPTRVQDGLHPLYDLSGNDRVVREAAVLAASADAPTQFLEGRPPLHGILPVGGDDGAPVRFERVIVLESGSKVARAGSHSTPTLERGRSTLFVGLESPADGSPVSHDSTYPVALAVANDLWKIIAAKLCMNLIDAGNDPWHVCYEVTPKRFHSRPMTDALIWAKGTKEPGKNQIPTNIGNPAPIPTPSSPPPAPTTTPDPGAGGASSRTMTPDAGPGTTADPVYTPGGSSEPTIGGE